MSKKMVMRLHLKDDKARARAMALAVSFPGVQSAVITGKERDELTLVGIGIDSVTITLAMRHGKRKHIPFLRCLPRLMRTERFGFAELVSVGEAKEEGKDKDKDKEKTQTPNPSYNWSYPHNCQLVEIWEPPRWCWW